MIDLMLAEARAREAEAALLRYAAAYRALQELVVAAFAEGYKAGRRS